jgi:hypothetical protein
VIIKITHREVKPTKDGKNKYLELTKEDGKKKVIFSDLYDKWELCQEGESVELKLDPNQNFKVVDIIPVAETPQAGTAIVPEESPLIQEAKKLDEEAGKMTKTDWAIKDAVTRKSIERQTALNNAVTSQSSLGEFDPEALVKAAQRFERYLETGK